MRFTHLRVAAVLTLCSSAVLGLGGTSQAEDATAPPMPTINVRLIGLATSEQLFQIEVFADEITPLPTGQPVTASWTDAATGIVSTSSAVVEADNIARFQIQSWRSTAVTVVYGASTAMVEVSVAPARARITAPAKAPPQQLAYRINLDPAAIGLGANSSVAMLSSERQASMTGKSWHQGCIAFSSLREVQINYWGVDGYRHRGILIANAAVVPSIRKAFTALYNHGYRLRSMHPVDVYGKNRASIGANDYASMAAGNTSMFNCRYQVGKEHRRVWSPHANGRALDINPWENPYLARGGVVPNRWWFDTRASSPLVIRGNSPVTTILRANNWRWGAWFKDYQHFDYRG
ncbi:MAG: M15 family metallopeptidase [Actinomycetota bacterium]|nr:M15 family metallopeptidase [Actinomycetota bacterium]